MVEKNTASKLPLGPNVFADPDEEWQSIPSQQLQFPSITERLAAVTKVRWKRRMRLLDILPDIHSHIYHVLFHPERLYPHKQ